MTLRQEIANQILSIINFTMTDEEKFFIRKNIMLSDEDWPDDYQALIDNNEESSADFKRMWGTYWATNGKNNLRLGKHEPVPKGFHVGYTKGKKIYSDRAEKDNYINKK